jgi:hypothetical protein
MAWVNKNFAYSTLNGGVLIGDTSIVVTTGANFPSPGAGDTFMCVIWGQAYANPSFDSSREVVLCTGRSSNTITITRAQESTSAKAWNSGDKIAHVFTAALLDTLVTRTGSQVLTNKTLTTPTIASMVNANHDHSAGAGGGVLPASSIGSGTLLHEQGGLESDVSAANGLVKISGGATSIVAAPSSTIVGISDSQTLSNKTISQNAATAFTDFISGVTPTNVTYLKDSMGFVHLTGSITKPTAWPYGNCTNTVLLPTGSCPDVNIPLLVQLTDGTTRVVPSGFYISTSGHVHSHDSGTYAGAIVYFTGVTFKAA